MILIKVSNLMCSHTELPLLTRPLGTARAAPLGRFEPQAQEPEAVEPFLFTGRVWGTQDSASRSIAR